MFLCKTLPFNCYAISFSCSSQYKIFAEFISLIVPSSLFGKQRGKSEPLIIFFLQFHYVLSCIISINACCHFSRCTTITFVSAYSFLSKSRSNSIASMLDPLEFLSELILSLCFLTLCSLYCNSNNCIVL